MDRLYGKGLKITNLAWGPIRSLELQLSGRFLASLIGMLKVD